MSALDQNFIDEYLPEWPSGPLDEYRKQATFDWRKMRLLLEGEDIIAFKHKAWTALGKDPVFARNPWDELTRDEERKQCLIQMKRLLELNFITEEEFISNPMLGPVAGQIVGQYSWSLAALKFLSYEYFIGNARSGGSKRHNKFMEDILSFKALGAISITELAHGSNTKALKTRATYDQKTNEWILHTPDLMATKVWSGVLGKNATHAVVFAQLYTSDGVCHGLHSFLVPIRDPKTMLPYKGILVGDMGVKIGLNGLDNGFMQFDHYRINYNCLMNRNAKITPEGKYVNKITDKSKRLGVTLGILSLGRVAIMLQNYTNLQTALIISIRYSAARRQFSPSPDEPEWPVLEYQMQQCRLIPYIAAAYVFQFYQTAFFREYINFFISTSVAYGDGGDGNDSNQREFGQEIHALSSVGKAYMAWIGRDAIQESREACGGHGYLKAARLGELRNDHDANTTYEGDNNVLLQQTSNYLLKFLRNKRENGVQISSPWLSVNYIDDIDSILKSKMKPGFHQQIETIIDAYNFLVCWLLQKCLNKFDEELKHANGDAFVARCNSQAFFAKTLAIAYFEREMISRFNDFVNEPGIDGDCRRVLVKLLHLFSLWLLEKHMANLYEADYVYRDSDTLTAMREKIVHLCKDLKGDAVSLVDTLAPPDFILNSSLGCADGKIYENIWKAMINSRDSTERPPWYTEFTENKPKVQLTRSKGGDARAKL